MKLMKIRRLNDEGLRRMEDFLESFDTDAPQTTAEAHSLLTDPQTSAALPNAVEVDRDEVFARRFDLAEYVLERVPRLGLPDPTRDAGLWAWLALLWFEPLCPKKQGGRRVPGEMARWLPKLDNRLHFYRHYILGPYMVLKAHQDEPLRAVVLLNDALHVSTSEVYRLFVESSVIACQQVIAAAKALYYDHSKSALRRGAGTKGPGGVRRLLEVLMQFDRTIDLYSTDKDALLGLLPREFDRFRLRVCIPTQRKVDAR